MFWYCRLDAIDRATHELDRRDATREMLKAMAEDGVRQSYRIDQLIEEAINSSLIEAAKLTTRAQAKQIILDGSAPSSRGEKMVLNNYKAMVRLLDLANDDLTFDDLLEIHAILGDGALDAEDCAGRLRRPEENVRVEDLEGNVWFTPPPAGELPVRLAALLQFANAQDPKPFLHPLVRAIVLHFWLAYLHPFVDGTAACRVPSSTGRCFELGTISLSICPSRGRSTDQSGPTTCRSRIRKPTMVISHIFC